MNLGRFRIRCHFRLLQLLDPGGHVINRIFLYMVGTVGTFFDYWFRLVDAPVEAPSRGDHQNHNSDHQQSEQGDGVPITVAESGAPMMMSDVDVRFVVVNDRRRWVAVLQRLCRFDAHGEKFRIKFWLRWEREAFDQHRVDRLFYDLDICRVQGIRDQFRSLLLHAFDFLRDLFGDRKISIADRIPIDQTL